MTEPTRPRAAEHVTVAPRLELIVEMEAGRPADRKAIVDGDEVRVGSHAANEVVLDDPLVSRFHFRLTRGVGGWRLNDVGSLNGTRIAGMRVRDVDLQPDETVIEAGASRLRIRELVPTKQVPMLDQSRYGALIGASGVMRKLYALLERLAKSDANVLIEGESGTGKELVATELVRRGPRAEAPFIVVDCSTMPANLIESTLFGHLRGSFTGAERDRVGAFEAAAGGTVFLDEIGELPLEMQPKLLRVLEAREVRRVGETKPRPVDVRVIAATNRQLDREMNAGRFREDLYFRLSVVTVRVPPLRERLEDVELLVTAMLGGMGAIDAARLFSGDVLEQMRRHYWPGNVRELRNYVERVVILENAVPPPAAPEPSTRNTHDVDIEVPFAEAKDALVARFERHYLAELLRWADGNVTKAARKAKVDRIHLHRLITRHDLKPARSFRE